MIDWNRVLQLREDVGADEFDALLEMFMDEAEAAIMRLDGRDPWQLRHDIHFLKGCALTLGFSDLGEICDRVERLAAGEAATQADIDAVLACYARSKQLFLRDLPHAIGDGRISGTGAA